MRHSSPISSRKEGHHCDQPGQCHVSSYARAADDFALALKMLGFEVADIIRMDDGITPDTALARKEWLDMARSAGAALGGN